MSHVESHPRKSWEQAGRDWINGDCLLLDREKLNYIYDNKLILFIIAISFIIRVCLRSNYLDDWDSINFALALDKYSMAASQPQPPGYPVYIFMGRLSHMIIPNATDSLVYLSILFGTLSIIAIYLLSNKFFGKNVGVLSALMLSIIPAHLKFSDVAMSDIVSLFFIIITIYLLYNSTTSKKYLYLATISLGITVGVRQTDILLIPLYLIFLIATRRNDLKTCILSIILLSISVCAWLIPTIIVTGLNTFIELQRSQGAYAISTSTLNTFGGFSFIGLVKTGWQFFFLLIFGWSISFLIFSTLTLTYIVYNKQKILKNYKDTRILIFIYWFLAYFIFSIFYYPLYTPRYLLPLVAPLIIIISYALINLVSSRPNTLIRSVLVTIIIICFVYMTSFTIMNGYSLHVSKPAPVLASDYIKEHFSPDDVIIIASDCYRHFQYYLPGYDILRDVTLKPLDISQAILSGKTLLADQDLPLGNISGPVLEFSRDRLIYPRHESVKLYQFRSSNKTIAIVPQGSNNSSKI
jgi:4-amino-4-deoxy-L-arabinose transferase-like glycosyltransferase